MNLCQRNECAESNLLPAENMPEPENTHAGSMTPPAAIKLISK